MRKGFPVLLVFAALLAASASAPAGAADCAPTRPDAFGPFGRGMPPLRAKTGSGHVLTGVVLSALGCRPLARAQVQFWQATRDGRYVPRLSATVLTDRNGRFRYESPRPVSYSGREPHIHIRVVARGHEPLLSRYVARTGVIRGSVRLVLVPLSL